MKFNKLYILPVLALPLLFISSCKKPGVEPLGSAGTTIVRLPSDDGYNLVAIDLKASSQTVGVLEIRRDAANEKQLLSTLNVIIKEDPSVVSSFNSNNGTAYGVLPANSFTVDPTNPRTGSNYNVTFAPGEFYKALKIVIPNATVLDPSEQYALGFQIASVDGDGKISEEFNETIVEIALKNQWDGHYKVTGNLVDLTVSTILGSYPFEADLETVSANEVILYHTGSPFTGYYHPITSGGSGSAYGSYVPVFVIDPATNKVTDVYNAYGQPSGNGRSAALDPAGINTWDPATKTLKVSYFLLQPGTTVRTKFTEVFTYVGPR